MTTQITLSRRTFLKVVGGVGLSFSLGSFASIGCAQEPEKTSFAPNAFLKIDSDGTTTVTVSKSDMGQGIRTTFAMLVAEDLDADWTKMRVVQAPGNRDIYGGEGTGGSDSTRSMHRQLRQIGATARVMLIAAAAKQWNVDPSQCSTLSGRVILSGGSKSLSYGDLASAASAVPVPSDGSVRLKDKADFKIIGKPTSRVDNPDVVTGKAKYGIDATTPNMAYCVIARPQFLDASVKHFDDSAARPIPGVLDVVQVGAGVAVVATNTWAAIKGRDALKIEWSAPPHADLSSAGITAKLKQSLIAHKEMPAGARVMEATFDFPYLAHVTMEPMNALADVREGRCQVWTGSQSPDGARDQTAGQLNLDPSTVTVTNHILGGGFGRRGSNDFVADAVDVSRAAKRPVKVMWMREDDVKHDQFRPMSHHSIKGAVDSSGAAVGWSHQAILGGGWGFGQEHFSDPNIPYDIPNAGMYRTVVQMPVPTGAWRSVDASQLVAVNECFIDELAHAAGKDPLAFRIGLASDERLKKVLQAAGEMSGWGASLPAGVGRGVACNDAYGSCVVHVVQVRVTGGDVKVEHVWCVCDPGLAINPKGIEAQLQGGFSDGIATALKVAITIEKGAVVQSSWDDYPWTTMPDMPKFEVQIIEGGRDPGGMGELGYPSATPAIANAVFAATGKRARRFPMVLSEMV